MSRSKRTKILGLIGGCAMLVSAACAQVPPRQVNVTGPAGAYLNEERLAQQSTVLLNNEKQLIPIGHLETARIASVHFTYNNAAVFDSLLNKYTRVQSFDATKYGSAGVMQLANDLKLYNTIILQVTDGDLANPQVLSFINSVDKVKDLVVTVFGSGRILPQLDNVSSPVVWCQRQTEVATANAAQSIFGGIAFTQKLQQKFSARYTSGAGFLTAKTRLQYAIPEEVGINAVNLQPIDQIAREAIAQHAAPGCVVLVAKDGKVIFNKAYGYHTYEPALPEKITDIFDLASVTKITATTMEVMRLAEQGKLNLDSTMGTYIPMAVNTNKRDIKVRELMLHQAGLIPYIPFYEKLRASDHSADSSAAFPTKVAEGYYIRKDYFRDVMLPQMLNTPLRTRGQYVYSDLSMYFTKEVVETITAQPLNTYVQQQFFNPLGAQTEGFLPRNRFAADRIIPTENDTYFRHSQLVGYVHDQGAAMVGGVSGHAGNFASANDLAIQFQMLLNKGTYGGVQYFKPETVTQFTSRQSDVSRRGLGFDGWGPLEASHYPSTLASPGTYGHTGYTGTCVWVDPKYNLVYIFLSNRVYPKVTDKLSSLRIRPRIQDVVYEAIQKGL
ncbi:serine hydrolase domain-containing protein [Mucilaginibacter sp.]